MTDDDPLAGAAIGETRSYQAEETIDGVNMVPMETAGHDRLSTVGIQSAEVIETENGLNKIRVTYAGELTKCAPVGAFDTPSPCVEQPEYEPFWKRHLGTGVTLATFAGVTALAVAIQRQFTTELTINGQSAAPATWETGVILFLVLTTAYFTQRHVVQQGAGL